MTTYSSLAGRLPRSATDPTNPQVGDEYYNTTNNSWMRWDGVQWWGVRLFATSTSTTSTSSSTSTTSTSTSTTSTSTSTTSTSSTTTSTSTTSTSSSTSSSTSTTV